MSARGLIAAAASEVAAYRSRTLMSVASIVVGIAAVTIVVALSDIGRSAILAALERQSGREATIFVGLQPPLGSAPTGGELSVRFGETALRLGANAAAVSHVTDGWLEVEAGEELARFVGTDAALADVRRLDIIAGRWLSDADSEYLAPVVVLNQRLADQIEQLVVGTLWTARFGDGQRVRIRVVGVVADGEDSSVVYMTRQSLERWVPTTGSGQLLIWVPRESEGDIRAHLVGVAERLGIGVEWQRVDDPAATDSVIGAISGVLAAIAALSLITGGIGVVNVSLLTIQQRTREFAVRRAFGASRRDIFALVFLETLAMVVLAGALGVGIALLASVMFAAVAAALFEGLAFSVPLSAAAAGLLISAGLAVATSLVPARAATRKDVIRAIRD